MKKTMTKKELQNENEKLKVSMQNAIHMLYGLSESAKFNLINDTFWSEYNQDDVKLSPLSKEILLEVVEDNNRLRMKLIQILHGY